MTLARRLLAATALVPLSAMSAAAQVTPDDVWTIMTDAAQATGATVTATEERSGATLTLNDIAFDYILPFGIGEVSLRFGPYVLTDLGDGTVSLTLPETATMAFAATLRIEGEEASVAGVISISQPGAETVASGTPDDITLTASAPITTMSMTGIDLTLPPGEDPGIDPGAITFSFEAADSEAVTRYVREAEVMRISSEGSAGAATYAVLVPVEFGGLSENTGGNAASTLTSEIVLPRTPMSVMNLSAAVRDGLSMSATSIVTGNESRAVTRFGDEVMTEQSTLTGVQTSAITFGPEGLVFSGAGEDTAITVLIPELFPLPLSGQIADVSARIVLPVLASPDAPVPVEYDIVLDDLSLDESIWSLFDPAQYLPRDPFDLTVDLGADIRPAIDALDIGAIMAAAQTGTVPVELDLVRIDALRIAGAGAEATGSGAFSLDFTDMMTFPGSPRPEGSALVTVTGANRLIDTLIAMGLLAEEDAFGARMGLGMFTKPVGDDVVESAVEVTPDGQVLVNGQRMR